MDKQTLSNHTLDSLVTKYKKWVAVGFGIYIAPIAILLVSLIGYVTYSYFDSELRWHPYKQYVYGGYNVGLEEGMKDRENIPYDPYGNGTHYYIEKTPWYIYNKETDLIKERALQEKEDYLAQFSESERSTKRADMKIQNIKMPLEKILSERHLTAAEFYTDYVDKKVKREDYSSNKTYKEALQEEAWRAGFEYGYARGRIRDCKPGSL